MVLLDDQEDWSLGDEMVVEQIVVYFRQDMIDYIMKSLCIFFDIKIIELIQFVSFVKIEKVFSVVDLLVVFKKGKIFMVDKF